MKIAYTGWTWLINHKDNEKFELEQSFKECKYLGYDYVENFGIHNQVLQRTNLTS